MSIGQDTEVFAYDTVKNRVVPAHTLGIPAKKVHVEWGGDYFRDGYAIEFNGPATTCRAGLWETMFLTMAQLQRFLPKHIKLIADPSADVDLDEIRSGPKDLHVLGCNPTLDPYAMAEKIIDIDPLNLPFRTTGAHLHYSFSDRDKKYSKSQLSILAKYCDLAIGLPFTVIFGDDKEFRRRTLYGQAGEFREQAYFIYGGRKVQGFEYRVLSTRLYNHPAIFGLFTGIFKYLLHYHEQIVEQGWDNPKLDEKLQRAINTGVGAMDLLTEFSLFMNNLAQDGKWKIYHGQGMSGIGYWPKDWGAAMVKLRDMRQTNAVLDRFQLAEGQNYAHYGWSEYNDGVLRSSTIGHRQFIKEDPWLL